MMLRATRVAGAPGDAYLQHAPSQGYLKSRVLPSRRASASSPKLHFLSQRFSLSSTYFKTDLLLCICRLTSFIKLLQHDGGHGANSYDPVER